MKQKRTLTIDATQQRAAADGNTIEMAIASEQPYERWFGIEILGHAKGEVDLSRLGDGRHPLLLNHDTGTQIGVIDSARVDSDGVLRGIGRFSSSEEAQQIRVDVADGIRTMVSVGSLVEQLVEMTGGGADYTFDCTGNTTVMRQALEACHRGWGESIVIGVAEAGKEIATRPFQLVTGRVWRGSAFGGARGRTDTPKIVDWYMDGKIEIDPMITHTLPLERINEAFDLMHAGESIRSVVVF